MEKSRITDEENIHNNTQRMHILLDTQQQQLQTVTSRLGKPDADEKFILQETQKADSDVPYLYLMKKN